jgi:hypothetical protein
MLRDWPLWRILALALTWVLLVGYLGLRFGTTIMTGSGPSGRMTGISLSIPALALTAAICLLPALFLFGLWWRTRR